MNTYFLCVASKKYEWCLKPFSYLFERYCPGATVNIFMSEEPKERWADGLLNFLYSYTPSHFVLLLDDYWINRKADMEGIDVLRGFMESRSDILRIDLTSDRLYAGGMRDIFAYDRFDIIEAPNSQYQMSLQIGIWNKALLIEILEKLSPNNRSAWNVELDGTGFVNSSDMKVYGTRQNLIRYTNAMNNGRPNEVNFSGLTEDDLLIVKTQINK